MPISTTIRGDHPGSSRRCRLTRSWDAGGTLPAGEFPTREVAPPAPLPVLLRVTIAGGPRGTAHRHGGAVGQHRKPQRRRRRWPFVALGAAVLIAAAGIIVYQARQGPGCTPLPVTVAVDPTVVDPVARALATDPDDVDPCARYQIVAAEPSLASEIRSASPGLPAVWIPQSSLALAPLGDNADSAVRRGQSLASSPIVLAVPTADAARYGDPAQPVSWTTALTSPRPPALPDPDTEPGGLAALTGLRTAIGDDGGRPKPAFVAAVLALHNDAPKSVDAGFTAMAEKGSAARAFVTSEHAVVQHNAQPGSAQP